MTSIVFDLDGTLVDSANLLKTVANQTLADLGLPAMTVDEARGYIGNGARVFLEKTLVARSALDAAGFEALYERFLEAYAAAPGDANEKMPGVDEMFSALKGDGCRLALCTNKPTRPTEVLIEALGWGGLFDAVICGDSLAHRKPHPEPLLEAVRRLASAPSFYVGDSEVDAETAQSANISFILYEEGYRAMPLEALPHLSSFAHFDELPELISKLAVQR